MLPLNQCAFCLRICIWANIVLPGLPEEAAVVGVPLQDEGEAVGDDDDGRLLLRGVLAVAASRVGVRTVEQRIKGCIKTTQNQ